MEAEVLKNTRENELLSQWRESVTRKDIQVFKNSMLYYSISQDIALNTLFSSLSVSLRSQNLETMNDDF